MPSRVQPLWQNPTSLLLSASCGKETFCVKVSHGYTKVTTTSTVPARLCRDFNNRPLLWTDIVLCATFSTPGRHNVCRWRCRYAGTWNIKTITDSHTLTKLQGQKIMTKDARGCWLTRVTVSVCLRQHHMLRLITCQMQLVRSRRCDKMITFSHSVNFCPREIRWSKLFNSGH